MKKEIPSILCLVELWSAAQGMMMVLPRGSSEAAAAADGSIIENSNIKLNVHSIARPTEEEEEKKLS